MMKRCLFLLILTFYVTDSAVNTTVGKDAELPCTVPEGTIDVLRWTKSNRPVLLYRHGKIEKTQDKLFTDRFQLRGLRVNSGNLTIQNVTQEDSGEYKCEAKVKEEGKLHTFYRQLTVSELSKNEKPPVFQSQKDHNNSGGMVQGKTDEEETAQSDNEVKANKNSDKTKVSVGVTAMVFALISAGIVYFKREQVKQLLQKWKQLNPNTIISGKEPLKSASCLA